MSSRIRSILLRAPAAFSVAAALLLVAAPSWADDDDDSTSDSSDEEKPKKKAKKKASEESSEASSAGSADEDKRPDHERVVGRVGFSWFGVSTLPIGLGTPAGDKDDPAVGVGSPASTTVAAPVIGMRYWISNTVGLDIGVGVSVSGGSVRATTGGTDKLTIFGMLGHFGLPLSITHGKHISLQITPETNIGFATSSVEPPVGVNPPPAASLSGFRFDLGARIGGEVQFGFIGIPELALEGSLGAYFTYQRTGVSVGEAQYADSSVQFSTASFNSPWDFFRSTVAARYYF